MYEYLIKAGFIKTVNKSLGLKNGLKRELFPGYRFEIWPEDDDGIWENSDEFYLYLFAERFGQLMPKLFDVDKKSLAWKYMPRKLRQDTSGGLGMVSATYKKRSDISKSILLSTDKCYMELKDFILAMEYMTSPQKVFDFLYKPTLNDFVFSQYIVLIEGIWVYLFLCKEIELSNELILEKSKEHFFQDELGNWGLYKDLDNEIISLFSDVYEEK